MRLPIYADVLWSPWYVLLDQRIWLAAVLVVAVAVVTAVLIRRKKK